MSAGAFLRNDRGECSLDPIAQPVADPADHAHIEKADRSIRTIGGGAKIEDVAGVGIGVEEAVAKDHVEEDARTAMGELVEVRPRRLQIFRPVEGDAVEKLHRQHAAGRVRRERFGEDDVGIARERLPEELQVPQFAAEVEFARDDALELGDHRHRMIDAQIRQEPLRQSGQFGQDADVVGDAPDDVRVLNLHRDPPAVGERRAMDLGDRRGRLRCGLKRREEFTERPAQFLFDGRARDGQGIRRDFGLEPGQFGREGRRRPDRGACSAPGRT